MAISKFDKYGVSPKKALVSSEGVGLKKTEPDKFEKYDVDLSRLDVHVLTNELLIKRYNENNDTGLVKKFFKRLKINSQDRRLNAMLDLVRTIREHSNDIVEYKAHLASQQQVFEIIADGKIDEAELQMAEMRASYQSRTELVKIEAERARFELEKSIKMAELELERMKHENERARWEAEKIKYEAEEGKQQARIIELRGDLISTINDELNFADINMKQVFVLIEMVKNAGTPEDILGAEAKWEQMKAEARKSEALADQEETKADHAKFKFEFDKKGPSK